MPKTKNGSYVVDETYEPTEEESLEIYKLLKAGKKKEAQELIDKIRADRERDPDS